MIWKDAACMAGYITGMIMGCACILDAQNSCMLVKVCILKLRWSPLGSVKICIESSIWPTSSCTLKS